MEKFKNVYSFKKKAENNHFNGILYKNETGEKNNIKQKKEP